MSDTHRNPSDAAMDQFEQKRMTRREALRKIGLTSGSALLMFIGVDNLARIAADKLQEHVATKQIGETLAREFRDVGAAFAATGFVASPSIVPSYCHPDGNPNFVKCNCIGYPHTSTNACLECCEGRYGSNGTMPNQQELARCVNYECHHLDERYHY